MKPHETEKLLVGQHTLSMGQTTAHRMGKHFCQLHILYRTYIQNI